MALANQRFTVESTDGTLAFRPEGRHVPATVTQPTSRGIRVSLIPGVTPSGRYRWTVPLDRGQRLKQRRGTIVLLAANGRAILRVTRSNGRFRAPPLSSAPEVRNAQTEEEPPSAGVEGDGIYIDYSLGTDIEAINFVPVGDPEPLDCEALQSPSGTEDGPPSNDGKNVNLVFQEGPLPAAASTGPQARAALIVCPGFLSKPFKAGEAPGFFGFMYGRSTLQCPPRANALFKSMRVRLKRLVGGRYKERRVRQKRSLGGAASLLMLRTVCRNSSFHNWMAAGRFTAVVARPPFVLSDLARTYNIEPCA